MSRYSQPQITVQSGLSHHAVKTSLIRAPLGTYETLYGYYFKHNIMYTDTETVISKPSKVLKATYKTSLNIWLIWPHCPLKPRLFILINILLSKRIPVFCLPFSFRNLDMNFFGGITPTFFFWVAILWKRSARQVKRFSFFFCWALYDNTFSRNGRQKYNACSTELQ